MKEVPNCIKYYSKEKTPDKLLDYIPTDVPYAICAICKPPFLEKPDLFNNCVLSIPFCIEY